jgi:Uma2 family endonuclease
MYQNNPVLRDYLLVSSTAIEIDLYHKNDAGQWIITSYGEGDTIELKSINLSFPIEEVYQDLNLIPES